MRTIRPFHPLVSATFMTISLLMGFVVGCEKKPIPLPNHPGGQLFHGMKRADVRCAKCHGDRGEGSVKAPALVQGGKTLSQDQFVATVMEGRNRMPPFRSVLTEDEIISIMDWLSKVPPK